MQTHKLELENIKCGGCANSIKSKLINQFGAKNVEVDNESGIISFDFENEYRSQIEKTLTIKWDILRKGRGTATQQGNLVCKLHDWKS